MFPRQPATILTVWEPFVDVLARTPAGFGLALGMVDNETIDEATREGARNTAEEGAELARGGTEPQPRICALVSTVAAAILEQADEVDATAIVIGTRGLTGVKSLLIGSVSHSVVQHSAGTVLIGPRPTSPPPGATRIIGPARTEAARSAHDSPRSGSRTGSLSVDSPVSAASARPYRALMLSGPAVQERPCRLAHTLRAAELTCA